MATQVGVADTEEEDEQEQEEALLACSAYQLVHCVPNIFTLALFGFTRSCFQMLHARNNNKAHGDDSKDSSLDSAKTQLQIFYVGDAFCSVNRCDSHGHLNQLKLILYNLPNASYAFTGGKKEKEKISLE